MSKFIDKLQHVYQSPAPPIGFRKSAAEAEKPPVLIVADLTGATIGKAKAIAGSIDAGVLSSESLDVRSFGRLVKAMGDIPLGLFLESANQEEITRLVDSGCDFVVLGLKTPAEAVREGSIGKILKIEPSLDYGLVRAINELPLPVGGVLVAGEESPVTVERLLICQRFADLLNKPLLTTLGTSVTGSELGSLYEAGVKGVVLPGGLPSEAFVELRKTVGSLPRTARRKAKGVAVLPQLGGGPGTGGEEEEEEEEGEEI